MITRSETSLTHLLANAETEQIMMERRHLQATAYVGVASYAMLLYDHLLTFSDEVVCIWEGHRGPIFYLFLFNRYFFPLAFIGNLIAYLSPHITPKECRKLVRFEGATALMAFSTVGLMLILRVHALYQKNRIILAFTCFWWIFLIAVYAWLLAGGQPVPHRTLHKGCTLIFKDSLHAWSVLSALAPLIFDTVILLLTSYRAMRDVKANTAGRILRTFFRDGVLYFSVLFMSQFAQAIMLVTAPAGLKNILGQFTELIAITMMSRITLSLRKKANRSIVFLDESGPSGLSGATATGVTLTQFETDVVLESVVDSSLPSSSRDSSGDTVQRPTTSNGHLAVPPRN